MLHSAIQRARNQSLIERRSAERYAVHIPCNIVDATMQEELILVENISINGLLAHASGKFQIGAEVRITLSELGEVDAVIRWCGNGRLGCEFNEPIEDCRFARFISRQFWPGR